MHPSKIEWSAFYAHMLRRTGLDLHQYKAAQLQRRIQGMMESRGARTLEQFWTMLTSEPDGLIWFMDKLAINVSELFRNPEKWQDLEERVLPDLFQRTRDLKAWSAGCSIGAEAHTLAIILAEKFPGNHKIIGTDIDQAALAQASAGRYSDADMRSTPEKYRDKYFLKSEGYWHANSQLKKYLTFRTHNLLQGKFDSGFDLIVCRNVVIYFTDEAKNELYRRFYEALKPGGVLFVGSTERIFHSKELGFETPLSFFYQKPQSGDRIWRNAS